MAHGTAAGAVCVLAIAAALTGCGSDSGGDTGAPGPTTPSRSAEPSPASPTPSPTRPSASPSPTEVKPVKPMKPSSPAELRSCADGSCTVIVTKGTELPRAAGLRAGPFTVGAVSGEGVDISSVDPSGFTSNLLGQRPDQGGPATINELSISVLAITGDTAKLRLFPAK